MKTFNKCCGLEPIQWRPMTWGNEQIDPSLKDSVECSKCKRSVVLDTENGVNEWNAGVKVTREEAEVFGDKWSDEEFELFEQERCKAVRESVDSCEYAGVTSHVKDKQKLMNTSILDIDKGEKNDR